MLRHVLASAPVPYWMLRRALVSAPVPPTTCDSLKPEPVFSSLCPPPTTTMAQCPATPQRRVIWYLLSEKAQNWLEPVS